MAEHVKENPVKLVKLHDESGHEFSLRRAFIVSALGDRKNGMTEVVVDEQNQNRRYMVKESVDDIPGPFARVGNLIFNPAYVVAVGEPNTGDKAEQYPYIIRFHTPQSQSYISANEPKVFYAAIEKAIAQGPC